MRYRPRAGVGGSRPCFAVAPSSPSFCARARSRSACNPPGRTTCATTALPRATTTARLPAPRHKCAYKTSAGTKPPCPIARSLDSPAPISDDQSMSAQPLGWMRCGATTHYLSRPGFAICGEVVIPTSQAMSGGSRHACAKCRKQVLALRVYGPDSCALCGSALYQRVGPGHLTKRSNVRASGAEPLPTSCCNHEQ
jgi:hypothetical protein